MSKATSSSSSSSLQYYSTITTSTKSRRHRREEEEEEEIPVDTGSIRCICSSTEDDGFTIQCERCLVWQHAYCVKITHASVPDHYLCDQCSKRKRPKLSKRIPISKKKLKKLDSEDDPSFNSKKKKHVRSRIVSRYVHPIFREAKERWSQSPRWKQPDITNGGPILYDHGPFVTMDATTLLTKGVLIDTPASNQGLFATRSIPSLRYLMEVTGDVMLKSEFKFDPMNDFVILGTPLSHIMFYPTLDLCIDTRQFGNKARYIRRSCHPNAELRNVIMPRGSTQDDKTIHLGLFARHLIEKGQEVTISWNWQRGHIAWKENMNWHHQHKVKQGQDDEVNQVIDEEEERRRKTTIQTMLDRFEKEFGSCACISKRRCLIEQLRRQVAPPKEKPAFKLPAQVNILPPITATKASRRKSSIILLQPKPESEKKSTKNISLVNHNSRQIIVSPTNSTKVKTRVEESSVDIDVISNSPTLGPTATTSTATNKDTSDDELLDVDGDIDIGDELPGSAPNMKLPLLDANNNSDNDDNADLSSLSSLSSLSVFEESGNDMTDDEENRIKQRKKKNASRHGKSSRSHHHHSNDVIFSTPATFTPSPLTVEKKASPVVVPAVLPRKKLWMRDYLNKSVTPADQSTKSPDDPPQSPDQQQPKTEEINKNISLKPEEENYTTTNLSGSNKETVDEISNTSTADINNKSMDIDEEVQNEKEKVPVEADTDIAEAANETASLMKTKENGQLAVIEDVVMAEAEKELDAVPESSSNIMFDIDDGELSDASTILLDEEEIRQVYSRRDSMDNTLAEELSTTNIKAENVFIQQENLVIVDDEVEKVGTEEIEVDISEEAPSNGAAPSNSSDQHFIPQTISNKNETADEPVAAVTKETKPPPAIKKISLQEYLSSNQKSISSEQ